MAKQDKIGPIFVENVDASIRCMMHARQEYTGKDKQGAVAGSAAAPRQKSISGYDANKRFD
jgi:hypothetical protein